MRWNFENDGFEPLLGIDRGRIPGQIQPFCPGPGFTGIVKIYRDFFVIFTRPYLTFIQFVIIDILC